jgi:S-formylglutathione hydrolase FrmB
VFNEQRFFRVFLPLNYDPTNKKYPVVYFFHGYGERYNQSSTEVGNYDIGDSRYGNNNIAAYVANHDLIVVKWDGFNPRYAGDTYPRPYNIGPVETYRQFPLYFPELVSYVDSTFPTIADRNHRGISGVSMGGFMSYWVSGKYPDLVNSASSFMGSPEFFAGPIGAPTEYLHTPMYGNYNGVYTRLVTGSQDFIRWYHRRMNATWLYARPTEHQTQDYNSSHGTPGMADTLNFHMNAFANPLIADPSAKPAVWNHADIYATFNVWGYSVTTNKQRPGFTLLENVTPAGFRSSVREWLPEGKVLPSVTLNITTDATYQPGATYNITDVNIEKSSAATYTQNADANGRLSLTVNGDRHEIGITAVQAPVISVAGWRIDGPNIPTVGSTVSLKLKFLNKGAAPQPSGTTAVVEPLNSSVTVLQKTLTVPQLDAGRSGEPIEDLQFQASDPNQEIVKLRITIGNSTPFSLEVPVFPNLAAPTNLVVNDGSTVSMWVNATSKTRKAMGAGNSDGVVNPGETISLLLPDSSAYRAGEMFTFDSCVDANAADNAGNAAGQYLHWRLSDSWTSYDNVGASVKYSLPIISSSCPVGHQIPFFVRYQLPNAPEDILRQGVVTVTVSGSDKTVPQPVRAEVANGVVRIDLREGSAISSATAVFSQKRGPKVSIPLRDDGVYPDLAAGDGIFAGTTTGATSGSYSLSVTSTDTMGNSGSVAVSGTFQLP